MGWESSLTGMGSWNLDPDFLIVDDPDGSKDEKKPTETDASLRERILYVAGDSASVIHEISVARGADLDDIAARFCLKRLGTP